MVWGIAVLLAWSRLFAQTLTPEKDFSFAFSAGGRVECVAGTFRVFAAADTMPAMIFPSQGDFLRVYEDVTYAKFRFGSYRLRHRDVVRLENSKVVRIRKTPFGLVLEGFAFNPNRKNKEKNTAKFSLELEGLEDGSIRLTAVVYDRHYNRIRLTLNAEKNEQYFGGGAQFSHFNLTGKNVRIFCEEQGVGRGDRPLSCLTRPLGVAGDEFSSYAPVPYLIADRPGFKRGFLLECAEPMYFDLRDPERPAFDVRSHEFTLRV
ncbi:MAG: hypothetical protein NZ534_13045, partial [Bacteroidia bacterium]|nr:hypothetical protein [Bacteroidia bacterium]